MWEEPPVSGDMGSGTIFFCGCTLRCVYCQNHEISKNGRLGSTYNADALSKAMLSLQSENAANINLVTPTPHIHTIVEAIYKARDSGLNIPIVYNTNSYMTEYALKLLRGIADVYIADLKYVSGNISQKLSMAEDYYKHASRAIELMLNEHPENEFDETTGLIKSGVIIRHLVLPGHIDETRRTLDSIRSLYGTGVTISLMGQYIPAYKASEYGELKRRLLRREYMRAVDYACALGFDNLWIQKCGADDPSYVPKWEF